MLLPPDIRKILYNTNTEILLDWTEILFFFQENQNKLTIRQKRQFFKRSEQYRTFWNSKRVEDVKINKNGKWMDAQVEIVPLDIEIKDISPNELYTDKSIHEATFVEETSEWILSWFSIGNVRFQLTQFLSIIFQKA